MESSLYMTRSFAKINLGLQVIRRRADGYHELSTGFCFLDWSDRMEMKRSESGKIICDDDSIPAGKENLIHKASALFNRELGKSSFYEIKLDKRIPAGAGLGGGSSNAASMLKMMNKDHNEPFSTDQLSKIGGALGADIPVFIHGKTAIGSGTGTDLEFISVQPDAWIVTVFPNIHSSTAEAYRFCEPTGEPDIPLKDIFQNYEIEEWPSLLFNDLEPGIIARYPQIGNLKDQMYDMGAAYAAMSGSGSSVYGLFLQEMAALEAYQYLIELEYRANLTSPEFTPDMGVYRTDL